MMPALSRSTVEKLRRDLIGFIHLTGGNPLKAGALRRHLEAKGIHHAVPIVRGGRAYFREQVRHLLPDEI